MDVSADEVETIAVETYKSRNLKPIKQVGSERGAWSMRTKRGQPAAAPVPAQPVELWGALLVLMQPTEGIDVTAAVDDVWAAEHV